MQENGSLPVIPTSSGAASDDMGAAIHGRLRLVNVAGIEDKKILSPSVSARTQAP